MAQTVRAAELLRVQNRQDAERRLLDAYLQHPMRTTMLPSEIQQEIKAAEEALRAHVRDVEYETVRNRIIAEAEQTFAIARLRRDAHLHLNAAAQSLRQYRQAIRALSANDVYDVEVVEGSPHLIEHALTQAEVTIAALRGLTPTEEMQ